MARTPNQPQHRLDVPSMSGGWKKPPSMDHDRHTSNAHETAPGADNQRPTSTTAEQAQAATYRYTPTTRGNARQNRTSPDASGSKQPHNPQQLRACYPKVYSSSDRRSGRKSGGSAIVRGAHGPTVSPRDKPSTGLGGDSTLSNHGQTPTAATFAQDSPTMMSPESTEEEPLIKLASAASLSMKFNDVYPYGALEVLGEVI